MVQRLFQTLQDMGSVFGFLELKPRTAGDHFLAVVNEFLQHALKPEYLRLDAVHQSQHVEMECLLKLGVFEKLIKDLARESILLQVYGDAQTFLVGLVADVLNAVYLPLLAHHQLGDVLDELGFVDLIWYLRDDDLESLLDAFHHIRSTKPRS